MMMKDVLCQTKGSPRELTRRMNKKSHLRGRGIKGRMDCAGSPGLSRTKNHCNKVDRVTREVMGFSAEFEVERLSGSHLTVDFYTRWCTC